MVRARWRKGTDRVDYISTFFWMISNISHWSGSVRLWVCCCCCCWYVFAPLFRNRSAMHSNALSHDVRRNEISQYNIWTERRRRRKKIEICLLNVLLLVRIHVRAQDLFCVTISIGTSEVSLSNELNINNKRQQKIYNMIDWGDCRTGKISVAHQLESMENSSLT